MRAALAVLGVCWWLAAQAASDRTLVVVSDLHLGAGRDSAGQWRNIEDFRWHDDFVAFLGEIRKSGRDRVDLVLAGDVFELWQSPLMKCSADLRSVGCVVTDCTYDDADLGCEEQQALQRLRHVIGQHAATLDALKDFATQGENAVYVVPGNHDAALLFELLRKELQGHFSSPRVNVLSEGAWLSPDRKIVVEHGHQFDDLNSFPRWPQPFATREGKRYIVRPWGENMVQQFYNQYEQLMPIVDNLKSEADGARFAIEAAGLKPLGEAAGKFARFFLFESSVRQILTALGDEKGKPDEQKTRRYLATLRQKPPEFFLDVVYGDPQLARAVDVMGKDAFRALNVAELSDEELRAVCAVKDSLRDNGRKEIQPCPPPDENLGAALKGLFIHPDTIRAWYLRDLRRKFIKDGNSVTPQVYIFGHTHVAKASVPQRVDDGAYGDFSIEVANTGAFQRVVTKEQVRRILAEKKKTKADATFFDLRPEDLPACYSFIYVGPYANNPGRPELRRWSFNDATKTGSAAAGGCPED